MSEKSFRRSLSQVQAMQLQQRQLVDKRTSWATSDWEDLSRSIGDTDDQDENDSCPTDRHPWLFQDCSISSRNSEADHYKSNSSWPETPSNVARPGSLLELILQEDSPVISGCDVPEMRRRGSMQERKNGLFLQLRWDM